MDWQGPHHIYHLRCNFWKGYPLNQYWVVLFGSYVVEKNTIRSDIDVAVITQIHDHTKNFEIWQNQCLIYPSKYDIKVFELLPLFIQMEIITSNYVLFGDRIKIFEYFYFYRKLFRDMEPRIKENRITDTQYQRKTLFNV